MWKNFDTGKHRIIEKFFALGTQFALNSERNILTMMQKIHKQSCGDLVLLKRFNKKSRIFNFLYTFPEQEVYSPVVDCGINKVLKSKIIAGFAGPVVAEGIGRYNLSLIMPLFSNGCLMGVICILWEEKPILENINFEIIENLCYFISMLLSNEELLEKIKENTFRFIKVLAELIDKKDKHTYGHSGKVMKYSVIIARKMKLSRTYIDIIRKAALLHDLGKLTIEKRILQKRTPLTEEEWKEIKRHPVVGADVISRVGLFQEIVPLILHHHEYFGGGGYPNPKLKGYQIPLGARIIAVADAYDAMNSDRPYRRAFRKNEITREFKRCAGAQFDPQVVKWRHFILT